jgi:hypothetical protein
MAKTEQHFELRVRFKTVTKNDEGISTALFRIALAEGFPQFLQKQLPFHKLSPGDDYQVEISVVEPLLLEEVKPATPEAT